MSVSGISTYGRTIESQGAAASAAAASAARQRTAASDAASTDAASATTQATEDVLDLSAEATAAADAADTAAAQTSSSTAQSSLLGRVSLAEEMGGTVKNGVVTFTIAGMEASLAKAQAALQAKLDKAFSSHSIDTSREIKLQIGGDGQAIVANDNPQRAEIEKLFQEDPSLRDALSKVNRLTEFIGSVQESLAFQQAYARDPYKAVAQYSYLFDGVSKSTASLSILVPQPT